MATFDGAKKGGVKGAEGTSMEEDDKVLLCASMMDGLIGQVARNGAVER
jgi:hypothetical protein